MQIKFDREEYLSISSVFENESLDDVDNELSEFNDDATDMAYELAYTRYALAKEEKKYNALREAAAWARELREAVRAARRLEKRLESECGDETEWKTAYCQLQHARDEVDRLLATE